MREMENSANTPTSASLEGQGRAVSMPKLNAEMQVRLTNIEVNVWLFFFFYAFSYFLY